MKILNLFILITCNVAFSQNVSITDLENFCLKQNWESVNTILKGKGWQYFQSSEGDYLKYSSVVWSFEKSNYNDKAKGWISLYLTEGSPEKVDFQISDEKKFTALENQLAGKGYKLKSSEVLDNELNSYYHNSKYYLNVIYSKSDDEDDYYSSSSNTYHIIVTAKGSEYDPDNGPKVVYNDEERLEYTLKDGELEGKSIAFYSNGEKRLEQNWIKGVKNGPYTEYDELGQIVEVGFYKADEFDGELKIFESNKLLSTRFFKNGLLNGKMTKYHENGRTLSVVTYVNDVKQGEAYEFSPSGDTIIKHAFVNGGLEGPFYSIEEVNGEQLKISGHFVNDMIEGKVYSVELKSRDTLRISEFKRDERHGLTTTFNHQGQILTTEIYQNNKLNGLTTKYIAEGKYTGEIFYKANYLDDLRHGLYEQYYEYIEDNTGAMYFSPATFIRHFEFGDLNGKATNILNGIVTQQGEYRYDKKNGEWFEIDDFSSDGIIYKIKSYGKYLDDEKEGIWVSEPEGPFTMKKKTFKQGLLNGVTTLYDNLGKPVRLINFKNDELVSCTYLENETPFLKLLIVDKAKDVFEVTNYFSNITITAKFDVSTSLEVLSDPELLEYYLSEIGFSNNILEECKFKSGYFTYKSLNYEYNGYYTNNIRSGNWHAKFNYEGETIESVIEYLNGEITKEYFTYSNNEPYNDKLEYYHNGMKVTSKIKKGFRQGKTEYFDTETGELVKVKKYKDGLIEK